MPGVLIEIVALAPRLVVPFVQEYVPTPLAVNDMDDCEQVRMVVFELLVMLAVGSVKLGLMVVELEMADEHPPALVTLKA